MRVHHAFQLALLAALASSASAQQTVNNPGLELADWPNLWGQDYQSMELGQIDDDIYMDAIVHEGDRLVFLPWLDMVTAPHKVKVAGVEVDQVNDFVLLGGLNTNGTSTIAAARDSGLDLYSWDGTDFQLDASLGSGWGSVTELDAADWDGDGMVDLVGLANGGTEILLQLRTTGGWIASGPVALPVAAIDFEVVQFDADLEAEVALVSSGALDIYDPRTNQIIYNRGSSLAPGYLARIEDTTSTDDLAWVVGPDGNGNSYVLLVKDDFSVEVTVLSGYSASQCQSAFVSGDANSDLVIVADNSWEILTLENTTGSANPQPVFNSGADMDVILATPIAQQGTAMGFTEAPALADIEGNGSIDIAIPSIIHGGIAVLQASEKLPTWLLGRDLVSGSTEICMTGPTGSESLRITASFDYDNPPPNSSFRTVVFIQGNTDQAVGATAISNCPVTVTPSNGVYTVTLEIDPDPAATSWLSDDRLLHILFAPVDSNGDGAGIPIMTSFTFDVGAIPGMELESGWTYPDTFDCLAPCGTTGCGGIGGAVIGAIGSTGRMPPFGPSATPVWTNVPCVTQ